MGVPRDLEAKGAEQLDCSVPRMEEDGIVVLRSARTDCFQRLDRAETRNFVPLFCFRSCCRRWLRCDAGVGPPHARPRRMLTEYGPLNLYMAKVMSRSTGVLWTVTRPFRDMPCYFCYPWFERATPGYLSAECDVDPL